MSDPTPPASTPIGPTPDGPAPDGLPVASARRPKRKRRWIWRVLIALPILLIAFVLLAPTLLGLGFVRSMIVPRLSAIVAPNGRLDVAGWKLNWFGGQRLENVRLLDDQNAVVAHLNVKTDASLWGLIRGRYALGDTTVNGDFDVRIDPASGRVNLMHIVGADAAEPAPAEPAPRPKKDDARPEPAPVPKPAEAQPLPIDLASVKGKVTINLVGTVSASNGDGAAVPFTKLNKGTFVVGLNDIERGVPIDGRVEMTVNDKPALLTVRGTVDAVERNVILTDPNQLSADLVATIEQLDLAVVKAVLVAMDVKDVDLGGVMKGKLVVDVKPGGAGSIRAENGMGIDALAVTAPALKGDTFTSRRVDFPLNLSRVAGSDVVTIEALGVTSDVATLGVTGTASQAALQNLAAGRPPGGAGTLVVRADVPDFAKLATMLPNAIGLQKNVAVTGGGLAQVATITIAPDGVKLNESLIVSAEGTADGKPIRLEKTTLDADADLAVRDGETIGVRSVRSMALKLVAPFATITGGGVPEKFQLDGDVDLTRFYEDVSRFVDLGAIDLKGKTNFILATNGLPSDGGAAFGARFGFNATGLVFTSDGTNLLDDENVKGDVDLLLKQQGDARTVTFRKLNVGAGSGLFGVWTAGDFAWLTLRDGVPVAGVGEFHLRGKLERLVAPFVAAADPATQLKRGLLDSTVNFAFDETKDEYKVDSVVDVTKLDVGDIVRNESLKLTATTFLPADLMTARSTFELASGFARMKGDADLKLKSAPEVATTPFEMARVVNFSGDVPSVAKLYALVQSLGGPAEPTAEGEAPLPPLKVEGGSLAFDGKISRDEPKNVTAVVLNVPALRDLALSRGTDRYRQAEPITIAFTANVATQALAAPPTPDAPAEPGVVTMTDQINRVVVSMLEANLPGVAKLTMPQAIEVTGLERPTPDARGTIRLDASLEPLGQMLLVANGSNPFPVAGTLVSEQKVATSGDSVALVGTGTIDALRPLGPDAKPLPDNLRRVELANDVSLDMKDPNAPAATIRRFDVVAPDARDVLALAATGTIRDLGTKNRFDGVEAKVSYDLAQLWPLLQPFVDPTGESIGKVENLAGKYAKTFTVAGSYPSVDEKGAAIEFKDAVRTLDASGEIQIDSADLVEKGIGIANLVVPITVKGGVAKIAHADGSLPKAFDLNSGKGNLGGLSVDLTAGEPLLGRLKDHKLVTSATINPVLSNALGKYMNPVFPNATKATGLVSLWLSAERLRLGPAMLTPESGTATVVINLTKMEISNPLGEQLLGGLFNKASGALDLSSALDTSEFSNFRGEMKDATFTLARGVVTQNATFMIGNIDGVDDQGRAKLYPFSFAGDVRLADQRMNLDAGFPMQLVKQKAKGDAGKILAYLPDSLKVGFGGTTTQPKLDFNDAGRMFSEAFLKFGAAKLAGGDRGGSSADGGKKSDVEQIGDVIGDLLGGNKKDAPRDERPADDDRPRKKRDEKK